MDTVAAVHVLRKLASLTNGYIDHRGTHANVAVVGSVSRWITKMLQLFGLTENGSRPIDQLLNRVMEVRLPYDGRASVF